MSDAAKYLTGRCLPCHCVPPPQIFGRCAASDMYFQKVKKYTLSYNINCGSKKIEEQNSSDKNLVKTATRVLFSREVACWTIYYSLSV